MFFRPRFIGGGAGGAALPENIHDDPDQIVQGGTSGEHYHLTEDEHSYLQAIIANPIYSEPVMTSAGDITTASNGDIVMVLLNVPT